MRKTITITKRHKFLTAILGSLLIVGAATTAYSLRSSTALSISVTSTGDFSGAITSTSTCMANRTVRLFRQAGATQDRTVDAVVGTTKTLSSGAWSIPNIKVYANYYARTPINKDCKAASSPTIAYADKQPSFPIRAAFYYPWFPETWGNLSAPFTNYHPTLGYYDSSSSSVIHTHIQEMQYAGIDAGIASWWGQGTPTDGRVNNLLRGADGTDFRWALYYEPEGTTDPSSTQIQSDLQYIVNNYGKDPNFLRVNGRPVVFVYGGGAESCTTVNRWINGNTVNAYLVLKVFSGFTTCANQPDGWHQYGPAVATDSHLPWSYAVSPGFYKKGESAPRLARDTTRFASNVRSMVASGARWQLITTFNEWGEGTSIEPATEWQNQYLDILHDNGMGPSPSSTVTPSPTGSPSPSPTSPPPPGKKYVFIWMENKENSSITASSAPYLSSFAANGRNFTNFFGVTHPSLPNYLAFASGGTQGKSGTDSIRPGEINATSVWDQLSAAGVTWKVYQEDMPSTSAPCQGNSYTGTDSGRYALKHNPATPFAPVFTNSNKCVNVVPLTRLDFSNPQLPQVSFITPNLCNDMHDCSVATGDNWLKARVPALLNAGATVVITFDEGSSGTNGGGHIYTAVDGPGIAGNANSTTYNHYSTLAGLENAFGLNKLGAAANANPLPLN